MFFDGFISLFDDDDWTMSFLDYDDNEDDWMERGSTGARNYGDMDAAELLNAAQEGSISIDTLEEIAGYHLEKGNFDDALKFLRVLTELTPYSSEAWERTGMALNNLGQY